MNRIMFFAIAFAVLTMIIAPMAKAQDNDGWRSRQAIQQNRGEHRGWNNNHRTMRYDNGRDDYRNRNHRMYRQNCELRIGGRCVVR